MWLLPLCVSACGFVSFEDVSRNPAYSNLVQKHFRSTGITRIHGVTRDDGPVKTLHYYTVEMLPGFRGREVLSREELPPGTEFQVMKIMRCKECYLVFEERVHLVVHMVSSRAYDSAEIRVPIYLISGEGPLFVEISCSHDNRSEPCK